MQIPSKVRIGGIDYKVRRKPNPSDGGNTLCYGVFDSERCVIDLNSERDMHPDRLNQTFLHELLHGQSTGARLSLMTRKNFVGNGKGALSNHQGQSRIFEVKK